MFQGTENNNIKKIFCVSVANRKELIMETINNINNQGIQGISNQQPNHPQGPPPPSPIGNDHSSQPFDLQISSLGQIISGSR